MSGGDFAARVVEHAPLAARTTLGVGGPARWLGEARSEADVLDALAYADARGVALVPLGAGSNVVVADGGLDALVLAIALRGIDVELRGASVRLTCAAGEPWQAVVDLAVDHGWAGLECLAGIPGLVGATPVQNVGAYGQQVGDTIVGVRALERSSRRAHDLPAAACAFGYRDSTFRSAERDRWVVLGVTFELAVGGSARVVYPELQRHLAERGLDRPSIADVRDAVVRLRRRKGMVLDPQDPDTRSAGSFFVNPSVPDAEADAIEARARTLGLLAPSDRMPRFAGAAGTTKVPAAWLIERAGFAKGFRDGGAGISHRHALALVNAEHASAGDVLRLASRIRREVRERLGVTLEPEPVLLGCSLS